MSFGSSITHRKYKLQRNPTKVVEYTIARNSWIGSLINQKKKKVTTKRMNYEMYVKEFLRLFNLSLLDLEQVSPGARDMWVTSQNDQPTFVVIVAIK